MGAGAKKWIYRMRLGNEMDNTMNLLHQSARPNSFIRAVRCINGSEGVLVCKIRNQMGVGLCCFHRVRGSRVGRD